jgi:hypothetical protein
LIKKNCEKQRIWWIQNSSRSQNAEEYLDGRRSAPEGMERKDILLAILSEEASSLLLEAIQTDRKKLLEKFNLLITLSQREKAWETMMSYLLLSVKKISQENLEDLEKFQLKLK